MKPFVVFLVLLIVRLISVFAVKTWFVPDEYWQSLEVGHRLAFGYGYLTWEWTKGIRSYIYPSIIALVYKFLSFINLDTVGFLVLVPRILQALLSSVADYRFYIWTGKKKWALFLAVIQWFWFYTASRTLSNTVETALTTIALSYFPWSNEGNFFLWLVGFCCFVRPTAVITWLPLCVYHLKKTEYPLWEILLKKYVPIGITVFGLCTAVDSYAHGSLIFTPYEFFKYNVYHNVGEFYGSHPWYWYFNVGLPVVLGILTFPFLFAIVETVRYSKVFPARKWLLISITTTLVVFSLLSHKEFRFVLPLLPMCLYICCDYLSRWSKKPSSITLWVISIVLIVSNAVPALYLSQVHQRGSLDVMPKLSEIAHTYKDEANNNANILFLMPCHSTPYYSHIHANVSMHYLTCDPDFQDKGEFHVDEAEDFYKDPAFWLRKNIPSYPKTALPTHLVMYDSLAPKIVDFLLEYDEVFKTFHTEYPSKRIGKNIVVYERRRFKNQDFAEYETDALSPTDEDPFSEI